MIRSFALLFALVMCGALSSAAQTPPTRWMDPTGGWSIDYMSSGWGRADGLPPNGPVLLTVPMQAPPNNETRMCFVEESYSAIAPGAVAAEIQRRGSQVGVPEAQAAFQRFRLTQTQVSHEVVDGVAVAIVEGASGGNRFRGRAFVTAAGNNAALSTISCISVAGMAASRDAEVDTILASLHFSAAKPDVGLSLLAPDATASDAVANAEALDAQMAEMLAIYREACFGGFPDEPAVAAVMSAHHARDLSQDEVRRYLYDDPGVGWVIAGNTAQFVVTVERPPFHTCAIRTMTVAGFQNSQPYADFVAQVEAGRAGTPIGHIDRIVGNVRSRGQGDQFTGADGGNENLLVFVSIPASGRTANGASTEVRFARQLPSSRRN